MKMKTAVLLQAILILSGCAQITPIEHGWKTTRVVATRMTNSTTVRLDFPLNRYDGDRVEVGDWIEEHDGYILEGGGSPGAPTYVQFTDARDVLNADKKMKAILPGLSTLLSHLEDDVYMARFHAAHIAWDKAHKPQWPNTTPPDKRDPDWSFNNSANINGTQYMKVEVSPGRWQWVVDQTSMERLREYENRRRSQFAALSARKLTHKELMSVSTSINIEGNAVFFAVDKYAELYDALAKQWELQKGHKMEGYRPLSTAKGEYNRSPQEEDSRRAVEALILELQRLPEKPSDGTKEKQ